MGARKYAHVPDSLLPHRLAIGPVLRAERLKTGAATHFMIIMSFRQCNLQLHWNSVQSCHGQDGRQTRTLDRNDLSPPSYAPLTGRSRGAREGLWANRGLQTWACEGVPAEPWNLSKGVRAKMIEAKRETARPQSRSVAA